MKLENFKNGYDVTLGSSLAINEKNDCAVRAFANAFNITYDAAHLFAADKFARKAKKGVKGMFLALVNLGNVAVVPENDNTRGSLQRPPNDKDSVKGHTNNSDVYIIYANQQAYP